MSKIKTLRYLSSDKILLKWFLKKPFTNIFRYLKAEKGSFPFFGVNNKEEFIELLKKNKSHLILGFSYCQKPLNCPSTFFSDKCQFDKKSPICQRCSLGRYKDHNFIIITTAVDFAKKLIEMTSSSQNQLFIISACPLAISLFKNFVNVLALKGSALVLEGSVCNTFECFLLAEKGKKVKSTNLPLSQKNLLDELLSYRM